MHTSKHTYGRKSITPKTKKLHPSIDLTAMVNLSFLLIMFFMLQSFIKKPNSMDLNLPNRDTCGGCHINDCYTGWRNFTLLLGENDKVVVYMGQVGFPMEEPKVFKLGSKEFRKELADKINFVRERVNNPEKEGLFVSIKPSDKCKFENLVTALDEISINKPRTFTVSHQINSDELKLLEKYTNLSKFAKN